jgi:hypothetical protein
VVVRNSTFRDNGSNGINSDLIGSLELENVTFTNNGLHAVRLDDGPFDPQLSSLIATGSGTAGTGFDAVVYAGISWNEGDHILEAMGLPYVFEDGFSVGESGHLVVQPGVQVQVENGFYVSGSGELTAVGTEEQPINFTGIITGGNEPLPWWGLNLTGDFDVFPTAHLEHVILEYGGLPGSGSSANLYVGSSNATIRNSTIRNGGMHGIYNSGGSPGESYALVVENTRIENNAGTAIVCDDESCNQSFSNISVTGNGLDAIVQSGSMAGNVRWNDVGVPYVIEGFFSIPEDSTLVIEPGVEVLMGKEATFNVYGSLSAVGTPEEPILFTGTQQEPGWWKSLWVHGGGLLELSYCDVSYGGVLGGPNLAAYGLVQIASNTAFISKCQLHHSAGAAIRTFTNVTPVILNNRIENNAAGLINDNGTRFPLTVDARHNWWGDPSGPTHLSNPDGTGESVTDRVIFEPWLTSPEQVAGGDSLVVQIGGVGRYVPGETVQYAIAYMNPTQEAVTNAVLRVALPANSQYIDSTGGGILWPERRQLFWRLGTLAPGASGLLAVRVTYNWGLPDGLKTAIVAQLGGDGVDEELFDVATYLDYSPRVETSVTELSATQVQTLRAGDPDMDAIFDQAEANGYVYGSATKHIYSTGEELTQVILLKVLAEEEDIEAFVIWRQESGTVGVALDGPGLTVHKPGRGLRFSLQTKQWQEVAPGEVIAAQSISWSDCMINCIEDKLPGEVAEELIKVYGVGKKVVGCVKAASGDEDAILECSKMLDKAIPGYGVGVELGTCNVDCEECEKSGGDCDDDKCHCCKTDKYRCSADDWLYGTFGIDVIMRRQCKDGKYLAETVHRVCALCEKCVMGSGTPVCVAKSAQAAQVGGLTLTWLDPAMVHTLDPVRADLTLVNSGGDQECEECVQAKDPNQITGPVGDLLPGQLVTYTIEYENVGEGDAFDVFIVNPLGEHFDLSTVNVHGAETDYSLSASTRRLYFEVGDLAPKGMDGSKGQVTYSVRLKSGLPSGTVIINEAVVHFPSVPEETPTNTAVNTIQPIAVPSQHYQVAAGGSVQFKLQGEDISGAELTFNIVNAPLYGTLEGTLPTLIYRPQPNFSGIDRLVFTAGNGTSTSRQAEVVFEVLASGDDNEAPTVKWTAPKKGAIVAPSVQLAIVEDGSLYTPYIQVQFSEAMAAETVNSTTVEVKDGTGQVVPVSVQYDATLDQAVVLMHEAGKSGVTYTATVKSGVTDAAGNPLAAAHVWSFTFGEGTDVAGNVFLPSLKRQ